MTSGERPPVGGEAIWQHDVFSRYRPTPRPTGTRVCILLGSADISGGTYVIFQHALALAERGVDVTIATLLPLADAASHWHPAMTRLRLVAFDELGDEAFDVVIATWWRTVYRLPQVRARQYAYFVQSIESRFASGPDDRETIEMAQLTYTFDLFVITITSLLQTYLAVEFNRPSVLVRNGIRKDLYSPIGAALRPRPSDGLRILVEGPLGIGLKNTERAIELATTVSDDVWLLTSTPIDRYDGVAQVCSRIPAELCGGIYRSCDVLLKLSRVEGMFGPPLEMFHCGGTAVVYNVTGAEEYIRDGENALEVAMEDEESVVASLVRLRDDRQLLGKLRQGALRTAIRWPGWDAASEGFVTAILTLANIPDRDHGTMLDAIESAASEVG
jgi:O-antigen biosynthesis protein